MGMNQSDLGYWLAIAGLGAFHGLNPAMGWLFAVALGQLRKSRAVVIASLAPILAGHAVAITLVLYGAMGLGAVIDAHMLSRLAGVLLIGWAIWHARFGHRHPIRIGMRTGFVGLGLWSFGMASAHGAGMMLLPLAMPLCMGVSHGASTAGGAVTVLAIVGVHTLAMLAVTAAIALIVYEWIGVGFLRRGWLNIDLVWSAALAASGLILVLWP
jgi:hypothetical protein